MKLMQEANAEKAEDIFVTDCFYVGREFGLSPKEVLDISALSFGVLLEELNKHYEAERKASQGKGKLLSD